LRPSEFPKLDLIEFYRNVDEDSNVDKLSCGELLVEFFQFYGFSFEPAKFAIDISAEKPFYPREDFIKEVKETFGGPDFQEIEGSFPFQSGAGQILRQRFVLHPEAYLYLVADPFNKGYNPAKVLVDSQEAQTYEQKFREAYA